jgi:hypothetical protein
MEIEMKKKSKLSIQSMDFNSIFSIFDNDDVSQEEAVEERHVVVDIESQDEDEPEDGEDLEENAER